MTEKSTSPNSPIVEEQNLASIVKDFFDRVGLWFKDFLDISSGVDREGTIIETKKNMRMRGHSAWLLMCSIMIASLGLDLNSPAVIIGAMLISPLMSPILGVGLAIGINDRKMLSISLQHFLVSIIIALVTSFLYFKLTPLGTSTPEIEGRIEPTTLDVLVAFFGGLAGIISGSRKDKSNAIPGVAIATALMPPLCVTGFGLANGQLEYVLGSFYLFFLNAVFVALATYLIVRLLGFAEKEFASEQERRRTQLFIMAFSVLMIIPSAWILIRELQDIHYRNQVEAYIENHFSGQTQCLDYEIQKIDSTRLLVLKLIGPSISEDSFLTLEHHLKNHVKPPTK
ncbi:MAG: TIGR00341 family protein, partial [Bacteroidota bacterium]